MAYVDGIKQSSECKTTNKAIAIHRQARIGLNLLQDAILEVLYEYHIIGEEWVKAARIREHLGFPKRNNDDMGHFPIRYILLLLSDEGKVEQREKGGPWRLTDAGFENK